jgi:hypothetical protein
LGEDVDVVASALAAYSSGDDVDGSGIEIDRIDDAVALANDTQTPKTEQVFAERFSLLLGI